MSIEELVIKKLENFCKKNNFSEDIMDLFLKAAKKDFKIKNNREIIAGAICEFYLEELMKP